MAELIWESQVNYLMPDDRYQVDSCHILLLPIYIKIGTLPKSLDTSSSILAVEKKPRSMIRVIPGPSLP